MNIFAVKFAKIDFWLLAITFMAGVLFQLYFDNMRLDEIKEYDNVVVQLIGTVSNEGIDKETYYQYILKNNQINNEKIKSKILIKSKYPLTYGNKIKTTAKLKLPPGIRNKNGFDYAKYLKTQDIYITAEIQDTSVLQENDVNVIENISYQIRNKVKNFTKNTLNNEEAGILNALIIGDDTGISKDIEREYKESGMIHLLIVSGGHTVFLLILLKYILKFFNISRNKSKITCIVVIILYIFVTGETPSILRAGIACVIVIMGELIGRQNDGFTTLFFVLLLILIKNPNTVFSLSLQLSFMGVVGIMLAYTKISNKLLFIPKIISEPLSLTISAQLFVIPIIIYNFNVIYLSGFISNIFTMSLSGIIMMAGMILFIINLFIFPLVLIPMKIVSILIKIMNYIAMFFSNINWLTYYTVTPNKISIILYYVLLIYVFAEKQDTSVFGVNLPILLKDIIMQKKLKRIIIIAVILIIICFNFIKLNNENIQISVIDVGHGDSILITTKNNKNILIDTGDSYNYGGSSFDAGEKIIVPYLLKRGIKSLDMLILTHFDSDHIGGYRKISDVIDIRRLGISINSLKKEKYNEIVDIAKENFSEIKYLQRGNTFVFDGIKLKVLLPRKEENIENENNDSIVLLMEYKNKKVLFMGDLEEEGEKLLLKLERNLEADVLKAGHHGSSTSSTENFINKIKPKIALISVGNRFSSVPGKEVLKRLDSVYCKVYRTDKNGEITVNINENYLSVDTIY